MTATEKYIEMNNSFCKLRDAIFNPNVVEKDEEDKWETVVKFSLSAIVEYLDYYKKLNEVKTKVKGE